MTLSTENIENFIEEYKKCTEICAATDYADKAAVKKHNKSVDRMDVIVETVASQGPSAIDRLAVLLDDDTAGRWLAFQLLDRVKVAPTVEKKCLSLIKKQASGKSPDALGAKYWLKEYKRRKR
jgi:hypothetical protein